MFLCYACVQMLSAPIRKTSRSFVPLFSMLGLSTYLFLSVLYIKGSLVIVFLSFCREEPGSTSLLYRKNSRLSCILSSLGRRFSGRTTQLLSPPHPILFLLFLFSSFPFSFLFPSLLFSLLLYFPPNLFTSNFLHPSQPSHTSNPSLRSLYLPGAFLCSDELTELAGTLRCLDSIDFK